MTTLGLIWAQARERVIGRDGVLPWHIPADLTHFKRLTLGAPVIMGRRTWESIPPRFRPLPGRRNIVLTRSRDWAATGAARAGNLDQALELVRGEPVAWVIGGAGLFAESLPRAQRLEVTEIDADFEGDTHAPPIGPEWHIVAEEALQSEDHPPLRFVSWRRRED